MSLDQIPVGFVRFGYFGAHLSSKWYSPSFHASSPHGLVDDLDADICIPGAAEARHVHMASSQVLLVKSASRFDALAECTWQNSCFGTRFSLSSFTSPARSRFPCRISQRAATSVKTTLDMYSSCFHRIAPARASLALARYANALCNFPCSTPPRSFWQLVCLRVHAVVLKCAHVQWTSVLMDCEAVALGAEKLSVRLVDESDRCRGILVFTYTILFFLRRPPSIFSAPGKVCSINSAYC
jgi:hypothetical protein